MSLKYVLHPAAESDLREVVRYSLRQWGEAQTRRYMDELRGDIEALAAGEKPSKELASIYTGLRVARCRHHFVFFIIRADGPALIVAVFHVRMDLMKRLARRLPK